MDGRDLEQTLSPDDDIPDIADSYAQVTQYDEDEYDEDYDDEDYYGGCGVFDEDEEDAEDPPTAFWEGELSQLSNPAINEAMLHQVPWDQVAKQFAVNMLGALAPMGAHAVLHGNSLVELPFFIIAALVLIISYEIVADKGPIATASFGTVAIVVPMIVSIVLHFTAKDPVALMPTMATLVAGTWMTWSCLVMLQAICTKKAYKSACYNAVTGRKVVRLTRRLDIVKLCKAMTYMTDADLKEQAGWSGVCYRWFRRLTCRKPLNRKIVLGNVPVDKDPDVPSVALELDGHEFPEGEYRITDLTCRFGSALLDPQKVASEQCLTNLQAVLKRKGKVTDQCLLCWLDPLPQPKGLEKLTPEAQKVKTYFSDMRFGEDDAFANLQVFITATAIDRAQDLMEHWAPRALVMSIITALFSLPARFFYKRLLDMQANVCKGYSSGGIQLPGGEQLCSHVSECTSLCLNSWSFIEAVNSALHTSHVESLFIFVLLPIFVFVFSVAWVADQHHKLEKKYLEGTGQSKAAIREVTSFKSTFDKMMNTSDVLSRFSGRFQAWNPYGVGDPDLTAKRSLKTEENHDSEYQNRAFEYVVGQILSAGAPQSVDETVLGYGVRVDPGSADDPAEDTSTQIYHAENDLRQEWHSMKNRNGLGGGSQRNFAVAFTVTCRSETAWKGWKAWLFDDTSESGYKQQLDYIFKTPLAQDSGTGSHLRKSVVIGDQAVPKGFSLTHIRTANPQDKSQFAIDLVNGMTVDKLKKEVSVMEKMLCAPSDDDSVLKPKLQDRLSDESDLYGIGMRFVLTEQYWANMAFAEKEALLVDVHAEKRPEYFADFVGCMLEPLVEVAKSTGEEDPGEDSCDMTMSYLTLIMGEPDPMKSLVATGRILAVRSWVGVLCISFMLIIPLYRYFLQGGKLFPDPFGKFLALNMIFSAFALWFFLNHFQVITERLSLVAIGLAGFEQRTIDPSGKAGKAQDKAKDKKKKNEEEEEESGDSRAFDLTVNEMKGCPYLPCDSDWGPYWAGQWKEKQDNVQNWHVCAGYMRVLVSASRLTSQAILLAAAVILAFVTVLSLVQAAQGKGMATINPGELADAAMARVSHHRHLSEHVDQARRLSISLAKGSMTPALGAVMAHAEDVSTAVQALGQQLQPFRQAMQSRMPTVPSASRSSSSPHRLLAAHPHDRHHKLKPLSKLVHGFDASKITKTQVLTIAMVLLLIFYSIPLLWNIAKINDCFDRHGNMLLAQKELHRMNMARRESKQMKAAEEAEGGEGGGGGGGAGEEGGEEGGADASEEQLASGEQSASANANSNQQGSTKDLGCRRYEKMVDMAIQAANKNKTRFPLKLFGFTINMALLTTWIILAVSPLAKQGQQMAPSLVSMGCKYIENSDFVNQADDMAKTVGKAAHDIGAGKSDLARKIDHFSMKKLVKEMVCDPLVKFTKEQADAAGDALHSLGDVPAEGGDTATEGDDARRLLTVPAIAPVLKTWWGSHAAHPYTKFVAVTQLLQDLDNEISQKPATDPVDQVEAVPTSKMDMNVIGTSQATDLKSWLEPHGLPESIKLKLETEAIDTVAKLGELSDDDVKVLCEGEKIGDKSLVKLLVKAARRHGSSSLKNTGL